MIKNTWGENPIISEVNFYGVDRHISEEEEAEIMRIEEEERMARLHQEAEEAEQAGDSLNVVDAAFDQDGDGGDNNSHCRTRQALLDLTTYDVFV